MVMPVTLLLCSIAMWQCCVHPVPVKPLAQALVSEIRRKLGVGLKIVILADAGWTTCFESSGFHCFVVAGFGATINTGTTHRHI